MSVVRTLTPSMLAMVQMGTNWSLSIWDIRYKSLDRFSLKRQQHGMRNQHAMSVTRRYQNHTLICPCFFSLFPSDLIISRSLGQSHCADGARGNERKRCRRSRKVRVNRLRDMKRIALQSKRSWVLPSAMLITGGTNPRSTQYTTTPCRIS